MTDATPQFDPEKFRARLGASQPQDRPAGAQGGAAPFNPEKFKARLQGQSAPQQPAPEPQVDTTAPPAPGPDFSIGPAEVFSGGATALTRFLPGGETMRGVQNSAAQGASAEFADEITAWALAAPPAIARQVHEWMGLDTELTRSGEGFDDFYQQNLSRIRGDQAQFDENSPALATGGRIAGGVMAAAPVAMAGAPAVAAYAPASIAGRAALAGAGGAAIGAAEGGLSGFGEGEGGYDERMESAGRGAIVGGGVGLVTGAAAPFVADAVEAGVRNVIGNRAKRAGAEIGASPEAVELTARMMRNDGGMNAVSNLDTPDAMLGDAGPATAGALDWAIQKAGPGGRIARDAIEKRATGAARDIDTALNDVFGPLGPGTEVVVRGDKNPLKRLYDRAYARPIDYASEAGRELEGFFDRVPADVVRRADTLMRMEGVPSKQRLIQIADDGTEVITARPDVRQFDYITRSLNDVAKAGDGKGALGGNTNEGRVYGGLAREIRRTLREHNPDYEIALNRAANEISIKQAGDLGEVAMRASTKRGELAEAVADMGQAELKALRRGVRQYMDDTLAKVKRTAIDASTEAREGLAALKELSSRASRDKMEMILGKSQTRALMRRIDQASRAFELRARTADNSKTFARQSMNDAAKDLSEPNALQTMFKGSPIQASQRLVQKLTAMTPQARREVEEKLAGDIAKILTETRGEQAKAAMKTIIGALEQSEAGAQLAKRLGRIAGGATFVGGGQSDPLFLR